VLSGFGAGRGFRYALDSEKASLSPPGVPGVCGAGRGLSNMRSMGMLTGFESSCVEGFGFPISFVMTVRGLSDVRFAGVELGSASLERTPSMRPLRCDPGLVGPVGGCPELGWGSPDSSVRLEDEPWGLRGARVSFVSMMMWRLPDAARDGLSDAELLRSSPNPCWSKCRHNDLAGRRPGAMVIGGATGSVLRRNLGEGYLSLLQFFLNHRVVMRSRRAERVGKTPRQLLTGQAHAHWLELLDFQRLGSA
jgi:hypothetical protein